MEYYSDVAIAMKLEDEPRFRTILEDLGGGESDMEGFGRKRHITSDLGRLVYYDIELVKWHLEYDDVSRIHKAIEKMMDEERYIHFMRVGENTGDVQEITSGPPCMYLSQKITKYGC